MLSYVISLTLLTLAVILVRGIFRNKMSSRLVYALWLAVIIRMVLPFDLISIDRVGVDYLSAIESAAEREIVLSASEKTENTKSQNAKPQLGTPAVNSKPTGEKEPIPNIPNIGALESGEAHTGSIQTGESFIPEINTDKVEEGSGAFIESGSIGENLGENREPIEIETNATPPHVIPSIPSVETETGASSEPAPAVPSVPHVALTDEQKEVSVSVKEILDAAWFVGALVTASVFAFSWAVFSAKLVKNRAYLTKSGKIKVYVSDMVASSCVCGIIPKIYVTPEARDSENLSTVILHEKVHVSHGDVIWNVIRVAAVSVFWYNPIVWVAAILSKRDAEFACDEAVALKLGDTSKLEYARMIVDMTPVKKNYAVSFAGGPIKERVLKLTRKHKNKFIVAAVVVLVIGICCAATFIGMNDLEVNIGETTTATEKETEKGKETEKENDTGINEPEPELIEWEVYEATEENIAKYAPKEFDVSGSEYNFSFIIVPSRDVKNFRINRLNWNEELLVESEEVIEEVGDVKAGEAMLITTDSVEIIGYVGISYVDGDKTARYYPATSGKDGSALLVEIGVNLLSADMLYPGVKQYEVTVSDEVTLSDALYALVRDEDEKSYGEFLAEESKLVTVKGLSVPVYLEFGKSWYLNSVGAYGHISEAEVDSAPLYYLLTAYEDAVIFNYHRYNKDDTWVFTPGEAKAFISDDVTSTIFNVVDSSLEYTRYSVKFYHPTQCAKTAPLDIAVSRDEFFAETGKAKVENGKLVLSELDTQTIDEAFDLDAIYEEYKLNYLGYSSADDVIERNIRRNEGKELPYAESTIMPDESFIGNWNDGGGDDIGISSISKNEIKFQAGVFRLFGFEGTAVLENGVWKFVEDGSYYEESKKIKGRLEFTESSVKVIYDDIGRFDYFKTPATYTMTKGKTSAGTNVTAYHGRIGRCGVYSGGDLLDSFLGYYTLTSVDASVGWYSITESVAVCNGGCKCDYYSYSEHKHDSKPTAEYGVSDGWIYPVKIYYSTPDEEIKEIYPQEYINQFRSATYVFDIGDGMHLRVVLQRYDSYDTPLRDNERELIDEIAKGIYIEYKLRDAKTGERIAFEREEIKPSAEHLELAKTDVRYKWIVSFLNGDAETCANMSCDAQPYVIADREKVLKIMTEELRKLFDGITVANYSVEKFKDVGNNEYLEFDFRVTESNFEIFPVGDYSVTISQYGLFSPSVYFTHREGTVHISDDNEAFFANHMFDSWYGVTDYPNGNGFWSSLVLFYLYERAFGVDETGLTCITPAQLDEIALEVYGEGFEVNDWCFEYHEGENGEEAYYTVRAMGGVVSFYNIISRTENDSIITYDVAYYADPMTLIPAKIFRYTVEKTDSEYGFKLVGVKEIYSNGLEILSQGM